MSIGKKTWIFADGDLPPQGENEPLGHEALMVVNPNDTDAQLELEIVFEDKKPMQGVTLTVPAKRVKCFRMDSPIGEQEYKIPFGQYALIIRSSAPVVANFGRLDRRKDMAYYPVQGYSV